MAQMYGYYPGDYGLELLVLGVMGTALMIGLVFSLALFLCKGFGLYRIAQRRQLSNAWLSWIPVGQDWIRGSISDQYQYLTAGKNTHRRIWLLFLTAVTTGLRLAVALNGLHHVVYAIGNLGYPQQFGYHIVGTMMAGGLMGLISLGVRLGRIVLHHFCMYDVYRSCDRNNGTALMVLGIFLPFLEPFFLIYVRNKDQGMPPRRDEPSGTEQNPYEPETGPVDARYETPDDFSQGGGSTQSEDWPEQL